MKILHFLIRFQLQIGSVALFFSWSGETSPPNSQDCLRSFFLLGSCTPLGHGNLYIRLVLTGTITSFQSRIRTIDTKLFYPTLEHNDLSVKDRGVTAF